MIFRQLFEPVSSTYTYLLGCAETGEAVLVDPVMPAWQRDLEAVNDLGLRLVMTLDTHIHADHITSASLLRREVGSRIAIPALDALPCADVGIEDGVPLQFGGLQLDPVHTPGHTDNHFAIVAGDRVFTGNALLIDGCGRTDFPGGDAGQLWDSIQAILALPPDTRLFVGHDYGAEGRDEPRWEATVAEHRACNKHVKDGSDRGEWIRTRQARDRTLALPDRMLAALQINLRGGRLPDPENDDRHYLKLP
ncbi:MAG: MBL fold metallo-hydrolase, partial [Proteobacteria bacterium]|nr:MBL fold metallo-hydrolase [Pseudomonadota bacterium]